MVAFTIKTNFPEVQRALDSLHVGIRDRALASAVNKTLDQGKTAMGRAITAEFNVTAAYVRDRLRIRRASARGQVFVEGALIGGKAGGKRSANVIAFVEKTTTLAAARRRAKKGTLDRVFVKIKRRGGAKPLAPGAFIGNNGRTVFERVGKDRLPIKAVQTIDVGQMFNTKRINNAVLSFMVTKLPEVFSREARFFVDRFNRGAK